MAWQQYVDKLTSEGCANAGIYDLQGNPWAYSEGFAAQIEEVKTVADAMKEGAANVLGPNGAKIAGVKYKFIKADENTAYVKLESCGVVFAKCNTCILVGRHDDKIQGNQANVVVGNLRDYLADNGI